MKNNSSIDMKNDFVRNFNVSSKYMDEALDILYKTSFNKLKLDNIVKIYYDKILELDDEVAKYNIDFWSYNFPLRTAIEIDFMDMLTYSFENLNTLRQKMGTLVMLSYSCTGKIANSILKKELDTYRRICNYINNYNLKRDIDRTIIYHFKTEHNYKLFTPGSFKELWEIEQKNLKRLNMEDEIPNLDNILTPIIENQEESAKFYQEIKNNHEINSLIRRK